MDDIIWHSTPIDVQLRTYLFKHVPITLFLTGLSDFALEAALIKLGQPCFVLGGMALTEILASLPKIIRKTSGASPK